MSSPWRAIPLGDAITFQRGFDLPHRARQRGNVPVVSSAGITDYHATAMCPSPGVITGRYGTIGELFYLEEPYWPLNTTLFVKDFRENDPRFIFYLLQRFDFGSFSGKSGVPGVNRNDLHAEEISIPWSITEQRAIAAALADVDAAVAGLERLIDKKRDLKQAAMQQLLTGQTRLPGFSGAWEVKRIGDFTDCTAGGTPNTGIPDYWGGDIPWMSSGELHKKQVFEVEGRITRRGLDESAAKIVPQNSVLIGLAGQGKTRGTVAIARIDTATNQSIAAIFPNTTFSPEFLYFVLDARYEELRELSSGDGGRGGLNLTLIRSIAVSFPLLEEQTAIAAVLSDMDAEISALQTQLDKTRLIKQAMMQELLTGRTRLPFQ